MIGAQLLACQALRTLAGLRYPANTSGFTEHFGKCDQSPQRGCDAFSPSKCKGLLCKCRRRIPRLNQCPVASGDFWTRHGTVCSCIFRLRGRILHALTAQRHFTRSRKSQHSFRRACVTPAGSSRSKRQGDAGALLVGCGTDFVGPGADRCRRAIVTYTGDASFACKGAALTQCNVAGRRLKQADGDGTGDTPSSAA